MDIAALKAACLKATPGPWNNNGTSVDDFGREYQASLSFEWSPNGTGNGDGINDNHVNDAAYIALVNPAFVLSFIESHDALVDALRSLVAVVEFKEPRPVHQPLALYKAREVLAALESVQS
jgi:hypothetical protein